MSNATDASTTVETTTDALPDWTGGTGTNLYQSADHEPSGLAIVSKSGSQYLYMVSDDGYILAEKSGKSSWDSDHYGDDDDHDFESVTMASGDLMIGIEGGVSDGHGNYSSPIIQRYDPTTSNDSKELGNFTGSAWTLNGMPLGSSGGMEALAFIPQTCCPSGWGTASYYGGFFLVSVQSSRGTVYVYDLPQGGGTAHTVASYTASFTDELLPLKISDMYFDATNQRLIVLYDDTARGDYTGVDGSNYLSAIQVLKLDDDTFQSTLVMRTPYVGSEAVTYYGDDLYIGIDQAGSKSDPNSQWGVNGLTVNLVTKYSNFDLP